MDTIVDTIVECSKVGMLWYSASPAVNVACVQECKKIQSGGVISKKYKYKYACIIYVLI